ncbi:dolichyl-P-Man:Man(7)GlcNAc(2)-PP-dolichol alpha-1,6-mannosyltransferase [Arachnomyces sp. PD_36]|nr:dolichyl-P-Man:Man(7)GlcNAc(2)-PP-dolichol alpha-1,6-mannosyltransferase [Arachnomyces sp. PD_36]
MARLIDFLLPCLLPALILLHLYVSPYTKVEESFNIQATHDILTYGIPNGDVLERFRAEYDHFSHPGSVPRTFIGALVLAGISRPVIWLDSMVDRQFLVRAVLGLFNAFALILYAHGIRRAFGRTTAVWYVLLQACQFHVIYYASRTLPNMFAFGISTIALRCMLPEATPRSPSSRNSKRYRLALYLLTVAGIIFRSEIAVLLATHTIYFLARGRISITRDIIPAGVAGLLIGLLLTISIDSFFWQQFPLWPEWDAFKFNVLSGQASSWGTEPWHFYFTNAIPRIILNPLSLLLCIPFSRAHLPTRPSSSHLLIPSLAYAAIYSIQPHKEWRFIIYIIPSLTGAAALGASYIWTHRSRSLILRLLSLALPLSALASLLISTLILLPASAANYPGAHALNALHAHAHGSKSILSTHIDNLACQTGVTRFLEMPAPKTLLGEPVGDIAAIQPGVSLWVYDKTEDEDVKRTSAFWNRFDYIIAEVDGGEQVGQILRNSGRFPTSYSSWEVVDIVNGFGGLVVLRPDGEERVGKPEREALRKIIGERGVRLWDWGVGVARRYVTRGWWVEVWTVPKVMILKKVVG